MALCALHSQSAAPGTPGQTQQPAHCPHSMPGPTLENSTGPPVAGGRCWVGVSEAQQGGTVSHRGGQGQDLSNQEPHGGFMANSNTGVCG